MSASSRLIPIVLSFALASCASTTVHYHTMLPPIAQKTVVAPPASFSIDVLPVGVPTQLDQSQLVVRQGQGGMVVLDGERWASPFGDEVRGALSSELTALLNTQDVAGLPVHSDTPPLRVKVLIRRFDAWPGQRVQLVAEWDLGFANDPQNARFIRAGSFDEDAVGDYAAMTSACQRAIMDLASRMASDAKAVAQKHDVAATGQ